MTQDIRFTIGAMDATGPAVTSATRNVDRLRESTKRLNDETRRSGALTGAAVGAAGGPLSRSGAAIGAAAGGMMSYRGLGPGGAFGVGAALNPAVMRFAGVAAVTGEALSSLREYVDLMKQAAFNGRTLAQELDKQGKTWAHIVPVARHFVDTGRLITGDLTREQAALGQIERLNQASAKWAAKRAEQTKMAADFAKQEAESVVQLGLARAEGTVESAAITRDAAIAKAEREDAARLEAIEKAGFTPANRQNRRDDSLRIKMNEIAAARERFHEVEQMHRRSLQEMRQAQESSARTLGSQLQQIEMETAGDLLGARLESIREAAQQRIEAEQQASERIRRLFGDESDEIKRGLQERVTLIEQLRDAEIQSARMADLEQRAQPFLDSIMRGHRESLERLIEAPRRAMDDEEARRRPFELVRGGLLHDAPGAGALSGSSAPEAKTAEATTATAKNTKDQLEEARRQTAALERLESGGLVAFVRGF